MRATRPHARGVMRKKSRPMPRRASRIQKTGARHPPARRLIMKVEFGQCGDCAFWGKAHGKPAACSRLNSANAEGGVGGPTKFQTPSGRGAPAGETNRHFDRIRFKERA